MKNNTSNIKQKNEYSKNAALKKKLILMVCASVCYFFTLHGVDSKDWHYPLDSFENAGATLAGQTL